MSNFLAQFLFASFAFCGLQGVMLYSSSESVPNANKSLTRRGAGVVIYYADFLVYFDFVLLFYFLFLQYCATIQIEKAQKQNHRMVFFEQGCHLLIDISLFETTYGNTS